MSLMITSEISKTYLQEEDAVKGFKAAVENNQTRLALQILTEIVDAFVEGFEAIIGSEEEQTEQKEEVKQEDSKPEKKTQSKKSGQTKEEDQLKI